MEHLIQLLVRQGLAAHSAAPSQLRAVGPLSCILLSSLAECLLAHNAARLPTSYILARPFDGFRNKGDGEGVEYRHPSTSSDKHRNLAYATQCKIHRTRKKETIARKNLKKRSQDEQTGKTSNEPQNHIACKTANLCPLAQTSPCSAQ